MLLAHGLGRTPFLDRDVAAKAFLLPDDLKINEGQGKWILRQWLNKAIPRLNLFLANAALPSGGPMD